MVADVIRYFVDKLPIAKIRDVYEKTRCFRWNSIYQYDALIAREFPTLKAKYSIYSPGVMYENDAAVCDGVRCDCGSKLIRFSISAEATDFVFQAVKKRQKTIFLKHFAVEWCIKQHTTSQQCDTAIERCKKHALFEVRLLGTILEFFLEKIEKPQTGNGSQRL